MRSQGAKGRRVRLPWALAAVVAASAAPALAAESGSDEVPLRLDPGDTEPVPRGAPPDPYRPPAADPAPRGQVPPGEGAPTPEGAPRHRQAQEAPEAGSGEGDFYYYDHDMRAAPQHRPLQRPSRHEVARGDTLWDITALYFRDPFQWPEVWAENPHITNPHWIFPGDEIHLGDGDDAEGGPEIAAEGDGYGQRSEQPEPQSPLTTAFALRRKAFVDQTDLEMAARIAGAPTERMLLAVGDTVYLDEVGDAGLELGRDYAVYDDERTLEHPDSGEVVGAYVELLGEVEILELREGERAVARISSSVDVIERGAMVGPLAQRFAEIDPAPPRTEVSGTIVGTLDIAELIGPNHLVILDRGGRHGVEVGNPLYVVRRGDGRSGRMDALGQIGQDEQDFPPRIVGQIHVVEVAEETSLGWVTSSAIEVGRGDRVIMRPDL